MSNSVEEIKGILKDYLGVSAISIESSDLGDRLRSKEYYYGDTYPILDLGVECFSRSKSVLAGYYIESNRPLVQYVENRYSRRYAFQMSEFNRNYIHGLIEDGAKESNALAVVYYEGAFKELKEIVGSQVDICTLLDDYLGKKTRVALIEVPKKVRDLGYHFDCSGVFFEG